jgi:hypothetical protein
MSDFQEGLIDLGNGRVKINFRKVSEDGKHKYQDALHFSQQEYEALTEAQIEAMKQERFDNWYAIITDPAPAPVIEDPVIVEEVVEEPEEFLIINGVKYIKSKE